MIIYQGIERRPQIKLLSKNLIRIVRDAAQLFKKIKINLYLVVLKDIKVVPLIREIQFHIKFPEDC